MVLSGLAFRNIYIYRPPVYYTVDTHENTLPARYPPPPYSLSLSSPYTVKKTPRKLKCQRIFVDGVEQVE